MSNNLLADLRARILAALTRIVPDLPPDLLDRREFELWLDTLAEDLSYRMPLVRNMQVRDIEREYVEEPNSIAWIDQDKELVTSRVAQIRTGVHWAEEPLSRTVHVTPDAVCSSAVSSC